MDARSPACWPGAWPTIGTYDVCALAWLNATEAGRVLGELPDTQGEVLYSAEPAAHLAPILAGLNAGAGSASRIQRLLVMARPASLDAGEITDKGYVNQRRVLAQRAELADLLYRDPPPGEVIISSRKEDS
ncbi:hypothetical protein [Nonomuraea sp. NPDC048916]|uniref:hypothetical protein n=1 Tax=Nonomuraea sp. NPDC048916 TaxID=3154232 RepID=UPI0033EB028A